MRKYRLLREKLAAGGTFAFSPAPEADPEIIALAHDRGYVDAFLRGELPAAAMRRIGFPWSRELVGRSLASVGATLAATRDAFESGRGGALAGGTHHAFHDYGSGFCVFNDIAVAVRWLQRENHARRLAIIDLDVHQGDGTAAIFHGDDTVLTVSLHGRNNFPFRKQQSAIDIEFEDGASDTDYLSCLSQTLPRVGEFSPEFVFYQSGVDALATDTLGRLRLTLPGLKTRDEMVFEAVTRLGVPLVVTLGGGYSSPIEHSVEAHAQTFTTWSSYPPPKPYP